MQSAQSDEAGLGDLLDSLSHGVQKNDCEGVIVYSNRAHHRILGYDPPELVGRKIWDSQPSEGDKEALKGYFETLTKTQPDPAPFLTRNRKKDGNLVELQVDWNYIRGRDGTLQGFISVVTDITERKKAEGSLRRRTQGLAALLTISKSFAETLELEKVLQATVDGVSRFVGLDTAAIYLVDGELLQLSATTPPLPPQFPDALRSARLAEHPNIGRVISFKEPVILEDAKKATMTPAERSVQEQRDLRTLLFLPLVAEDEVLGVLIVGSTGKPTPISATKIDLSRTLANFSALAVKNARLYEAGRKHSEELERALTERKRAEKERDRAFADLERQNRELRKLDEIKNSLIRDVSHELKTPVAKYAMQLEVLKPIIENHRLSPHEMKALSVMDECLRRQESVIRNLLDLSRLEAGGRKFRQDAVRLDELVGKVAREYRHLVDQYGGEVEISLPPLEIVSDGEMLWHLFSNLFSNAIKFRKKKRKLRITVRGKVSGGRAEVHVADEGEGLSPEETAYAFDRFYQSSASNEGSGVGLTICRMIAEGLGGSISIRSEGAGRGAVVSVYLPAP